MTAAKFSFPKGTEPRHGLIASGGEAAHALPPSQCSSSVSPWGIQPKEALLILSAFQIHTVSEHIKKQSLVSLLPRHWQPCFTRLPTALNAKEGRDFFHFKLFNRNVLAEICQQFRVRILL